jgi:MGT family glycosyltransferase
MSTAVVLNLPEHGHMNATYPVVAELVRRGERVVYYATEPYRERVEATGAEYRSYGNAEDFCPPAHAGGLYSVMAWEIGLAETLLPRLLEDLRQLAPDYLLIDSMCVWGHLARQVLGIPGATLGSVFVPDDRIVTVEELMQQAYGRAPKDVLLAGIDALNTYLQIAQRIDRHFGTESPNLVQFFASRQALNIVFTSRYFHLAGDQFDESYRFVGPTLDTPSRKTGDRPLVYISMGTIFNDQPDFYRGCFAALGGGPYDVVLSAGGGRVGLGAPPPNFTVCEFVDQCEVLSRASVFISHGGMNSASESLWNEVPMLVFPQHGDQHLVATRVEELGAGLVLRPPDVDPARLRAAVDLLLSEPRFREGAGKVAESFRSAGGHRRAAHEIMRWRCPAFA